MSQTPLRLIFMGTPAFAVPTLRTLHEQAAAQGWQIVQVLTQPDRPAGRGKRLVASPVKEYAVQQGLPVFQPKTLRKDPTAIAAIEALAPDLLIVAAYGLILPPALLAVPRLGAVNVHASLLPAYRGASPITAALLDGQVTTGVSIMLMDEGVDTGPVLAQETQPISSEDTTASLSERLAEQGAALLAATLPVWAAGKITPVAQSELPGEVSTCGLIRKEDGRIDWQLPAAAIERATRAYTPWPSAYTEWRGANFKIWRARVLPGEAEPGLVVATEQGAAIGTGSGLLLPELVQPAGKRAMPMESFVRGAADFVGSRLPSA